MKRHECLVRIATMPVLKAKKYNSTGHPNWKVLSKSKKPMNGGGTIRSTLNQSQENHLEGLRIRDLTF